MWKESGFRQQAMNNRITPFKWVKPLVDDPTTPAHHHHLFLQPDLLRYVGSLSPPVLITRTVLGGGKQQGISGAVAKVVEARLSLAKKRGGRDAVPKTLHIPPPFRPSSAVRSQVHLSHISILFCRFGTEVRPEPLPNRLTDRFNRPTLVPKRFANRRLYPRTAFVENR